MALVICRGELSADLSSLGGSEASVEAEGSLPVVAGLAGVAFGVVYAGEAVVSAGLLVLVANLAGQTKRGGELSAGVAGRWRATPRRGR